MSRIQPNTNPDPKSAEMLAGIKAALGSTPNIFTTLANSPAALGFYTSASAALKDSKLSPALREQVALTVAGANNCDYCASAHTTIGKMQKIDEAELARNLQGTATDAKTQAALTFARKVVDARGQVSDADVQSLRAIGYTEGDIVDLVAVICINIFTNYFNHIAATDVDFPLVSTAKIAKAA